MKLKMRFLISLIAVWFTVLSACGNASDETDNKQSNTNQAQEEQGDSADKKTDADGTRKPEEGTEGSQPNGQGKAAGEESAVEGPGQGTPSENNKEAQAGKKQEYLKKLEAAKQEVEALTPSDEDTSTVVLKKDAENRWQVWDRLLNDIYGVLKSQLPAEEMKELQIEQRNWLVHRDNMALRASEKYKGGTAEQLEYVSVLGNLTEQRCYELVRIYME